jgi:hypothetical protein
MESDQKSLSRKKFFLWGLGILSFFTVWGIRFSPKKKSGTAKMLTEDGRLVEVDIAALNSAGKKATNAELQNWVKK